MTRVELSQVLFHPRQSLDGEELPGDLSHFIESKRCETPLDRFDFGGADAEFPDADANKEGREHGISRDVSTHREFVAFLPAEAGNCREDTQHSRMMALIEVAQLVVEPVGKPCFGSRDLGK